MRHPEDGALNDHVDGRLDPVAAGRVDAHLEACAACRARVAAIRELDARLAGLPREIAPRRDLRPGIRERIAGSPPNALTSAAGIPRISGEGTAQRPGARTTFRDWRRAAVVILALAGAGTAVWIGQERGAPAATAGAGAGSPAGTEAVAGTAAISSYASAADQLARTVEARRAELSVPGARALDASLASLDVAILDLERARRSGVRDPELLRQLEARHRTRLELLRSAAHLLEES